MKIYTTHDGKGMYIDINGNIDVYYRTIDGSKTINVTSSFGNGQIAITRATVSSTPTDDLEGGMHVGVGNSKRGTFTGPINPDSQLDNIFTALLQDIEEKVDNKTMTQEAGREDAFILVVQDNSTGKYVTCDGCWVEGLPASNVSNASNSSNPDSYNILVTSVTRSHISLEDALNTQDNN